jgi:hypothetical protein
MTRLSQGRHLQSAKAQRSSVTVFQKYVTARIKLIVIKDQTVGYTIDRLLAENPFEYVSKQLAPVSKETYEDFLAKNESPVRLNKQFNLRVDYSLIGQEELDRFFNRASLTKTFSSGHGRGSTRSIRIHQGT